MELKKNIEYLQFIIYVRLFSLLLQSMNEKHIMQFNWNYLEYKQKPLFFYLVKKAKVDLKQIKIRQAFQAEQNDIGQCIIIILVAFYKVCTCYFWQNTVLSFVRNIRYVHMNLP